MATLLSCVYQYIFYEYHRNLHMLVKSLLGRLFQGFCGTRKKRAFILGKQRNKGHILSRKGGQRQYWGKGNITIYFWEQGYNFRGKRERIPPRRASLRKPSFSHEFYFIHLDVYCSKDLLNMIFMNEPECLKGLMGDTCI